MKVEMGLSRNKSSHELYELLGILYIVYISADERARDQMIAFFQGRIIG